MRPIAAHARTNGNDASSRQRKTTAAHRARRHWAPIAAIRRQSPTAIWRFNPQTNRAALADYAWEVRAYTRKCTGKQKVTVHTRHSQNVLSGLLRSYATTFAHKKALPSSLCIQIFPHASMINIWIHMMSKL